MKASATTREYKDSGWTDSNGKFHRNINKCWLCACSFRTGDVVLNMTGQSKGKKVHRACIRVILQDSYDEVPAKGHEIIDVTTDGAVEAYKKHLLEQWHGKEDGAGDQDGRDPQGTDGDGPEVEPSLVPDLSVWVRDW